MDFYENTMENTTEYINDPFCWFCDSSSFFFGSKSWANFRISSRQASWAVQTNRRYQKLQHLRMEKNWPSASSFHQKNQQKLKMSSTQQTAIYGRFSIFLGGETNKPIARKNADFKQVAGKLPATTRWPQIRGRFSGFSLEAIMEPRNWLFQRGGYVDLSRIWR